MKGRVTRIGLLGGSFNPAHGGHRAISLAALRALALDEVWWLVSPGNPLKPAAGIAPLAARLAAARRSARRAPIRVTDIETRLRTRYTVDTVAALRGRYPRHRFLWILGADIVDEFHRWRDWRRLARLLPIAVVPRPSYVGLGGSARSAAWLRRFVRPLRHPDDWTRWSLPAIVSVPVVPDPRSATAARLRDPDWFRHPTPSARPRPRLP